MCLRQYEKVQCSVVTGKQQDQLCTWIELEKNIFSLKKSYLMKKFLRNQTPLRPCARLFFLEAKSLSIGELAFKRVLAWPGKMNLKVRCWFGRVHVTGKHLFLRYCSGNRVNRFIVFCRCMMLHHVYFQTFVITITNPQLVWSFVQSLFFLLTRDYQRLASDM